MTDPTTVEGTPLEAYLIAPDYAQMYVRVEDPTGALAPFYVWRQDGGLLASHSAHATTDIQKLVDPDEWNDEYGGLCPYHVLAILVDAALNQFSTEPPQGIPCMACGTLQANDGDCKCYV